MFIWAWGVNGCFSVIGAAAAPVLATSFGLASVIEVAALGLLRGVAGLRRCNVAPGGLTAERWRAAMKFCSVARFSRPVALALAGCAVAAKRAAGVDRRADARRRRRSSPTPAASQVAYVEFKNSAFPYHGAIPASEEAERRQAVPERRRKRPARPQVAARRRPLGGRDLQRPPRAGGGLAELRSRRRRASSSSISTATTRRSRATWSAASRRRGRWRPRGSTRCWSRRRWRSTRAIPAPAISGARAASPPSSTRPRPRSRSFYPERQRAPISRACRW